MSEETSHNEPIDICKNCDHLDGESTFPSVCKLRRARITDPETTHCVNFHSENLGIFGSKTIDGPIWIDVSGDHLPCVPYPGENVKERRCPVLDWEGYHFLENSGLWRALGASFLNHQIDKYQNNDWTIQDEKYSDSNSIRQILMKVTFEISDEGGRRYWIEPDWDTFMIQFKGDGEKKAVAASPMPKDDVYKSMVFLTKLLDKMDPYSPEPQTGGYSVLFNAREVELKVITMPSRFGEIVEFEIIQNRPSPYEDHVWAFK